MPIRINNARMTYVLCSVTGFHPFTFYLRENMFSLELIFILLIIAVCFCYNQYKKVFAKKV